MAKRTRFPSIEIGQRHGFYLVLARAPNNQHRKRRWLCLCEHGQFVVRITQSLRRSHTRCACARGHGHRGGVEPPSPTYNSWRAIKERCYNPHHVAFKNYGGRGIVVCDRWRESFAAFLSDMGERPAYRTLDRIDVNGNYTPQNCKWATIQEQNANRRCPVREPTDEEIEMAGYEPDEHTSYADEVPF